MIPYRYPIDTLSIPYECPMPTHARRATVEESSTVRCSTVPTSLILMLPSKKRPPRREAVSATQLSHGRRFRMPHSGATLDGQGQLDLSGHLIRLRAA